MTDLELAARLREVAIAGYERWRKQRGWAAIVTPTPHRLIDEVMAGLAPVLRDLVREAVHAELQGAE
jgi:hypothetical protein